MTQSRMCPGAEQLAALVECRVTDVERRQLLEHIDNCEDCFTTFSDTARFMEESPPGRVVRGRFNGRWVLGLAAAAALLLAVFQIPQVARLLPWGGPQLASSAELLRPLLSQSPAPELTSRIELDETLSFAPNLSEEAAAFRSGVLLVDLRVAALAGNSVLSDRLARAGQEICERFPGVGLTAGWQDLGSRIRADDRSQEWLQTIDELEAASQQRWSHGFHFQLGRWTETARLALASGQPGILAESGMRPFLDSAVDRLEGEPAVRQQLLAIRDLSGGGTPALEQQLSQALSDLQRLF